MQKGMILTMKNKLFLGLDGGGTYTRVAIADTHGHLLCCIEQKGTASIYKDPDAKNNVQSAIYEAIRAANCDIGDIAAVAAGIAGLDSDDDMGWAQELTKIGELTASQMHVNDAVIAHCGAFRSKPGVIAISGTGSITFGINESGKHIRNYDFDHYAFTAARHIAQNVVYKIIAGETDATDSGIIEQALLHFGVANVYELAALGAGGFAKTGNATGNETAVIDRNKLFGDFTPIVTNCAIYGSNLAAQVCEKAAADIVTGIRLVGSLFESDEVRAALIGSVANSACIFSCIDRELRKSANKAYILQKPEFPPVLGAVIMATEYSGIEANSEFLDNLAAEL